MASTAFAGNIQVTDFFNQLVVATSATSAQPIFDAVRVNSIEMWALVGTGNAPTTVSITPAQTGNPGPGISGKTVSDTSMGTARSAHIKWRPDPASLQGMWLSVENDSDFITINCPIGTVIDVSCMLRLNSSVSPAPALVVAGAIAGATYYMALDADSGSSLLVPACVPILSL